MNAGTPEEPIFFASPGELREWFARHADEQTELWVGYHKRGSGTPGITWPESVDEALCVGWIDAVRRRIDDTSYKIRFTRRKPTSIWSAVNIRRVGELESEGRMQPAGRAAFERRQEKRSAVYAYEQRQEAALSPEDESLFRSNAAAWDYFQKQPPWYRRTAIWQVVSAKRAETREKRLSALIQASADGQPVEQLRRR